MCTCLDDIDPNVTDASIDLPPHEIRRNLMNGVDAERVLRRQGCRGSHGIAAMGRDNLLVGFEPSGKAALASTLTGNL